MTFNKITQSNVTVNTLSLRLKEKEIAYIVEECYGTKHSPIVYSLNKNVTIHDKKNPLGAIFVV